MSKTRCSWVGQSELDIQYHDLEWGVPCDKDQTLFEILTLEGAQAGLSWTIILKKREGYRQAFKNFDPVAVAKMTARAVDKLLQNPGIVRHRLKVESTISNARAFLDVQRTEGSFARYLWKFVDFEPIQNRWTQLEQLPTSTEIAANISKDLKRRGFRFVGPTICYAMMQAAGLVNDHTVDCYRHKPLCNPGKKFGL